MGITVTPITGDLYDHFERLGCGDPEFPREWCAVERVDLAAGGTQPCRKCGRQSAEYGMHLELRDGDGDRHDIIASFNNFDGLFTEEFKSLLSRRYAVRYRYSKAMGHEYLSNGCPFCNAISGDNFVFRNYLGRGGTFSNPMRRREKIELYSLPSFTGNMPTPYEWMTNNFAVEVEPTRLRTAGPCDLQGCRVFTGGDFPTRPTPVEAEEPAMESAAMPQPGPVRKPPAPESLPQTPARIADTVRRTLSRIHPISRWKRLGTTGRILVAGIGALLVAIIGWTVASNTVFSPQRTAMRYVDAIAQGRYDEANAMADPGIPAERTRLLTDRAFAGPAIRDVSVSETIGSRDGSVRILFSYTLGDARRAGDVRVTNRRWLPFPEWRITEPLTSTLTVSSDHRAGALNVNGIEVSAGNGESASEGKVTYTVYPGQYRISLANTEYMTAEPVTVAVGFQREARARLDVGKTDGLGEAIRKAIDEKIRSCDGAKGRTPAGCPFEYQVWSWNKDGYRNFEWKVTQQPELRQIRFGDGQFDTTIGIAQASFETTSHGNGWQHDTGTCHYYLNGSFSLGENGLNIEFSGLNTDGTGSDGTAARTGYSQATPSPSLSSLEE